MNTELRKEWYSRADVLSNLMPCLREREVCFLIPYGIQSEKRYPVRCIKSHHSSYLLNNMKAFDFFNRPYNLYHSIFLLENMPMFSYAPLKRSEQQQEFFRNYYDFVKGVDFVMDFDGDKNLPIDERIRQARDTALAVSIILDAYEVPYILLFSGSKGFHLEVRGFPVARNWNKRIKEFEEVAIRLVLTAFGEMNQLTLNAESDLREYLKSRYSFDSSIYTTTRIWKCPYSYDVSTDCIVYPLTQDELKDFNLENYRAEKLLNSLHWKRGLKQRPGTLENFWTLAKTLGVPYEHEEPPQGTQDILQLRKE